MAAAIARLNLLKSLNVVTNTCGGLINRAIIPSCNHISQRNYAAMGTKKLKMRQIAPAVKIVLPVETDPEKLVSYVCGSGIMKDEEDIKLKDDSEYPDWLWTLRTSPPPPLEELDTTTRQYWRRLRFKTFKLKARLKKIKKL